MACTSCSRVSGTLSSKRRRPSLVTTGCTVNRSSSMRPARKSERIVSMPPLTTIPLSPRSLSVLTYSRGSPVMRVLFHGKSSGKVDEMTCLRTELIHWPKASSACGQYWDHSSHNFRPMTTSVTGVITSVIKSASAIPNESYCQRCGLSTTPLRELKRCATTLRPMVVPAPSW